MLQSSSGLGFRNGSPIGITQFGIWGPGIPGSQSVTVLRFSR